MQAVESRRRLLWNGENVLCSAVAVCDRLTGPAFRQVHQTVNWLARSIQERGAIEILWRDTRDSG